MRAPSFVCACGRNAFTRQGARAWCCWRCGRTHLLAVREAVHVYAHGAEPPVLEAVQPSSSHRGSVEWVLPVVGALTLVASAVVLGVGAIRLAIDFLAAAGQFVCDVAPWLLGGGVLWLLFTPSPQENR